MSRKTEIKRFYTCTNIIGAFFAVSVVVAGCGSGGRNTSGNSLPKPIESSNITVTVSPSTTSLASGQSITFTAIVEGTSDELVHWTTTGGSISSSGAYTAPALAGSYQVIATSHADPSKSGTAKITVYSISSIGAAPMQLISRDVPAHASCGNDAGNANSGDYGQGCTVLSNGGWIAYDLSSVDEAKRKQVMVHWLMPAHDRFDEGIEMPPAYPWHLADGYPGPYVIECSNDSTNGTDGSWIEFYSEIGSPTIHERALVVDMSGYRWIRMYGKGDNSYSPSQPSHMHLKIDIYDFSSGNDAILALGDSITAELWRWNPVALRVKSAESASFPLFINGGIAFISASDVLTTYYTVTPPNTITYQSSTTWLDHWIALFPGRYVSLSYGSNTGGVDAPTYAQQMRTMVQKIIDAGKVPILCGVPWHANDPDDLMLQYVKRLGVYRQDWVNGRPPAGTVAADYAGKVLIGPDVYGFFSNIANRHYITDNDGLHPSGDGMPGYPQYPYEILSGTTTGYGAYRQLWTDWMIQVFYKTKL